MPSNQMSRRDYFKLLGAGSAYAASAMSFGCKAEASEKKQEEKLAPQESEAAKADRVRRMQWWHDAKFGMFQQDVIPRLVTGLPEKAPDDPVTVIAIECESEPTIDSLIVRKERKREHV